MFYTLLIIGTGGFLGSISRFLAGRYFQQMTLSTFPLGTLMVNLVGCLIIGIIYGLTERTTWISSEWRLFLAVGFCGGFTTFSSFANENISLLHDSELFFFFLYTGISVLGGFILTYLGQLFTKIIF
jgi:fluoride exporter